MNTLLDTCVVSELVAARPSRVVLTWIDQQEESGLYLSAITIGEIRSGIERIGIGPRRKRLTEWLEHDLSARFSGRIVGLDQAVMLRWGEIVGSLGKKGRVLPVIDSLIAATASHHGFAIATRDVGHFQNTGIVVVDPWRSGG